ncbi:hypothetical protein SLS54_000013 [Diplodia seriata]
MAPQRKESTAYGRETDDPKNKESSMAEVHHIDNLKDKGCPELPASLQDLSEDEFRAMEKKMVWKVDLRMLPLVIIMYILNYLDRNNIAAARLAGMEADLNLTGSQYQTSVSILFVGYVLMQGVLEGMAGVRGLASWRWLFILEGMATVVAAVIAVFMLPNFPHTTAWLSEQERQLAMWRLEQDAGETDQSEDDNSSLLEGFKMAAKEIKVYIVAIMLFCIASSASVLNFFPTVVETLGYGRTETLLLTAPPYVLCMFTSCFNAWNSDRTGERYFHCTTPLYVAIVAFVLAASTTAIVPRYISIMLMIPGFYSSWSLVFAWASNAIPRPAAKRAAALAMVNSVANCANIFGSYLYPPSHAPRYST